MKLTIKEKLDFIAEVGHSCAILIKGGIYFLTNKRIGYRGIKKSCSKMRKIAERNNLAEEWDEVEEAIMEEFNNF